MLFIRYIWVYKEHNVLYTIVTCKLKKANARSSTFGFCQRTMPTLKNQKSLPFPTATQTEYLHFIHAFMR